MKKTAPSYVERDRCPLHTAIQVIEVRWKPMIFQRWVPARSDLANFGGLWLG